MPLSARWLLAATCLSLLAGCPLPCPSGTTPHGGDQCDPDPVPVTPRAAVWVTNQTEKPVAIDFDVVSLVDCPPAGSTADDSASAFAAKNSLSSQSITLGVGATGEAQDSELGHSRGCTAVRLRVDAEGFQRSVVAWPDRKADTLVLSREASGALRLEGPRGVIAPAIVPLAPGAAPR